MNRTVDEIASELLTLPAGTRIQLAERLVESVGSFADENIADAWDQEVARRIQEYESGMVAGIPAESVLEDARNKLREARQVSSPRPS